MRRTTRLRELLRRPEPVLALGVYDGITARLAEQAGSAAIYMTGAGVSASCGYPDFGLLTMTEMVERAGLLARTASIPLISDADTGYGNELNVTRTVREFEARGVAAIHIEDQLSPKRCGHLEGKALIAKEEFVSKIRAAVLARQDSDFMIIARSDARAVTTLEDAIDRVNAALEAGADMAFVESPYTRDEIAAIPRRVNGPCLLNLVQGGKTPILTARELQEAGFRMAIMPSAALRPVVRAVQAAYEEIVRTGSLQDTPGTPPSVMFELMGASGWNAIRDKAKA